MKYSDIIKKLNEDTVYHGTDAEFDEFDYKFVGKGNDSYGYGFYFTTYEHAAQGYGKNVFTADINLKKPIVVSATDPKPEQFPKFSRKQIKQIILDAPEYEDVLWNFGDLGSSSVEKVLDIAVNEYTKTGDQFFSLMNDFYRDYPEEFNKAVHKATGYDGVEVFWKNEPEARFIIAWFKDQIKVIKKTVKESISNEEYSENDVIYRGEDGFITFEEPYSTHDDDNHPLRDDVYNLYYPDGVVYTFYMDGQGLVDNDSGFTINIKKLKDLGRYELFSKIRFSEAQQLKLVKKNKHLLSYFMNPSQEVLNAAGKL